jgi:hypothetical protein
MVVVEDPQVPVMGQQRNERSGNVPFVRDGDEGCSK